MNGRKIILAWNFDKQKGNWDSDPVLHKEMKIQGSKWDSLCAVIMSDMEEKKQILEILKFIAPKANDFTGAHMILLHETHRGDESKKTIQGLLWDKYNRQSKIDKYLKNCTYEFFGGGIKGESRMIYERLIEDTACFRDEAFLEQNVIKKNVFDAIWKEYDKKKIVRLKCDILSDFCPIVIDMRGLKECAERKNDAENYLGKIKKEDWALFSKDSLNKYDWPSAELREEIEKVINQIAFLGEIIEESKVSQNVIDEIKNKQFNIDKWYSKLAECFKRYT